MNGWTHPSFPTSKFLPLRFPLPGGLSSLSLDEKMPCTGSVPSLCGSAPVLLSRPQESPRWVDGEAGLLMASFLDLCIVKTGKSLSSFFVLFLYFIQSIKIF